MAESLIVHFLFYFIVVVVVICLSKHLIYVLTDPEEFIVLYDFFRNLFVKGPKGPRGPTGPKQKDT